MSWTSSEDPASSEPSRPSAFGVGAGVVRTSPVTTPPHSPTEPRATVASVRTESNGRAGSGSAAGATTTTGATTAVAAATNTIGEFSTSLAYRTDAPATLTAAASAVIEPEIGNRPARSLNVLHILNPAQPDAIDRSDTSSHIGSLTWPEDAGTPPSLPPLGRRGYSSLSEPSQTAAPERRDLEASSSVGAPGPLSRRILMPRSPASRVASSGRANLPAPVSATGPGQVPPIPARGSILDLSSLPASDVPPLPTPPALFRVAGSYGFPSMPTPPRGGRRASVGTFITPVSQSVSPTTSYSSYGQGGHASPAFPSSMVTTQAAPAPPQLLLSRGISTTYETPGLTSSAPPTPLPLGTSFRSMSGVGLASGHPEMLTLNMSEGPIDVPLDIQAASKIADDRRKRNAGASARFRQRRKEKEREASHTIAKLEQRIRDVTEERDFYRQERDHFQRMIQPRTGLVPRPPPPRPLSPARRRSLQSGPSGSVSTPGSATAGLAPPWSEIAHSNIPERNVRRRTDVFAGSEYTLPAPASVVTAPSLGPVSLPYGAPRPLQDPHGRLPGPSVPGSGGGHPPPPPSSADTYDPYAPDRYNRDWSLRRPSR